MNTTMPDAVFYDRPWVSNNVHCKLYKIVHSLCINLLTTITKVEKLGKALNLKTSNMVWPKAFVLDTWRIYVQTQKCQNSNKNLPPVVKNFKFTNHITQAFILCYVFLGLLVWWKSNTVTRTSMSSIAFTWHFHFFTFLSLVSASSTAVGNSICPFSFNLLLYPSF